MSSRDHPAQAASDTNAAFYVYRVRFPDGFKDVVSLVPHDSVFESGLTATAIVGVRADAAEPSGPITPANFHPNKPFVDLLHEVIALDAPGMAGLRDAARHQGTGWVYVVDARTPTPAGEVPASDILGAFEVRDGTIVPDSYRPNPSHQLLSSNGFFRLEPGLHERLMDRILKSQSAFSESTS